MGKNVFIDWKDQYNNRPNKNNFNLSNRIIFDTKIGDIKPFTCMEVVPGDEININLDFYLKSAPLIAPLFSNIEIDVRYFFVPHRLTFANWNQWYLNADMQEEFGDQHLQLPVFKLNANDPDIENLKQVRNLLVALGYPEHVTFNGEVGHTVNYMSLRAYNQIFYHYYLMKQNFNQAELSDIRNSMVKNDEAWSSVAGFINHEMAFLPKTTDTEYNGFYTTSYMRDMFSNIYQDVASLDINVSNNVSSIKKGFKIFNFFKNLLNADNDYNAYSLNAFGTESKQGTDRPIYIGGNSTNMNIGEIAATTAGDNQALGQLAGKGYGLNSKSIQFEANEFGYIIGIVTIMPEIQRSLGIHPHIMKSHPSDYYRPEFEGAYTEPITRKTGHFSNTAQNDNEVEYGYTNNFYDYKSTYNRTFGKLAEQLKYWNILEVANNYAFVAPVSTLVYIKYLQGSEFVTNNYFKTISDTLFAVPDEPHFFAVANQQIFAKRVMRQNLNDVID